ncbi:hypothetical protein BDV33DRAFT_185942 [Aspergillus novoparasiticus]|uniref:Uncharacterized protein n=1 Tax=Aspergillus novoparasiticus TaxID=986946 RepID=A0A5N6E6Z3_9EURO|nr:hypothetical protein BDV33DRAFT_185942 [Aspergillus novoparasiticus]
MFGVLPPEMALQALRAECILAGDADPDTICGIVREEIHCSRIKDKNLPESQGAGYENRI